MATNMSCESQDTNLTTDPLGGHQIWEVVVIVIITGPLSLVTIIGNLLVVISVQINSNLRTVNNYFLLSLAVADLILGAISMNLYTTYIIMGRWALGDLACDLWLAIDYVTSNASVMNLLVISFDRFFSVTRPLSYRAKRTPRKAKIMIVMAWAVSFVLWAPAILLWEYIVGKRTVKQGRCSIQFFSEPIITFATAIAAFYLPVTIMIVLYWRVYRETKNRSRDLPSLMGSVDRSVPVQEARWRSTYSSSNRSSITSSREIQAGESFPVRQVSRLTRETRAGTLSHQTREMPTRASSNGRWEVERGDASSLSSLESEQGQAAAAGAGVIKLSDVDGPEGSSVSKAQDPGIGTTGGRKRSSHTRDQSSIYNPAKQPRSRKRRSVIIKEKKAAKTLSAILLAFILTWTPYNIMVLVSIFYCVPEKLWQLGYWLCYVNSTVNPMCYALCNESFQVTFKMLLLCRWDRRKWGNPKNSTPPSLRPYKSSSVV